MTASIERAYGTKAENVAYEQGRVDERMSRASAAQPRPERAEPVAPDKATMFRAAKKALGKHRQVSPREIELIIDAAMKAGMAEAIAQQQPWPPSPDAAAAAVHMWGLQSAEDLDAAKIIAVAAIRCYGHQAGDEFTRATEKPWNDLAEVQAALAAIQLVRGLYLSAPRLPDGWATAISGIADDYMTSEHHHPGYVLIPTEKFELLRAMIQAAPSTGGAE